MILTFLDTETGDGLPSRWDAFPSEFDCWPIPIQFGFIQATLSDYKLTKVREETVLLNREKELTPEEFTVEHIHGISYEKMKEGVDPKSFLLSFASVINSSDIIVCHNVPFDVNLTLADFYRMGIPSAVNMDPKTFCTSTSPLIINALGSTKARINFKELYYSIMGEEMGWKYKHHDAGQDVSALYIVFKRLLERGIIPEEALN